MDKTIHLLNDICKNTEMGVDGVKLMQKRCKSAALHAALERQLDEYGAIYSQASRQLGELGQTPKRIPAAAKISSHLSMTAKGLRGMTSSDIAEMMVQGSTMGVIQITRQSRLCRGCDPEATALAAKLAETEERNIDDMKRFL
ncbi:MAG: hypothetical protein E7452_02485 [Ruminococcaceae bacterium]|nr:hypothetical protein [Oscillospiraceae bacterium]